MAAITQTEARRLRKRVQALEGILREQRRNWRAPNYFGCVNVGYAELDTISVVLRTARRCGHAVVAIADDDSNQVRFVALPHPSEDV